VAGDTYLIEVTEISTRAYGAAVCDPKHREDEEPAQASLLRCIFGNPSRARKPQVSWLGESIQKAAEAAYEQRALPSGRLDPARLAVLADMLEEAGCQDETILAHLRDQTTMHVRGCHVLDLLLGKA
jgi:hypothetical protein